MKLQMTETELIELWNEFCYDANYSDDIIYHNDEETFKQMGFTIRQTCAARDRGDYDFDDLYIGLNGYGNPMSSNDAIEFVDEDNLIEWLLQDDKLDVILELEILKEN